MKIHFSGLLLFLGGLLLAFWFLKDSPKKEIVEPRDQTSTKADTPPSPVPKSPHLSTSEKMERLEFNSQPVATTKKPPQQKNLIQKIQPLKSRQRPLPDHVIFEVKMGDWAVMFGDVLLGKVKGPENLKIGQYKPKSPQLWPNADIPFVIDQSYNNRDLIYGVLDYFHQNTPIRFFPAEGQQDGIVFMGTDEHCYSYLGKVGGFQPIFLSQDCQDKHLIHEIMHALGFVHEQSRIDRDSFVEILWDKINPQFHLQFYKVPKEFMIGSSATGFDYQSIMIYEPTAFAQTQGEAVMRSTTSQKIQPESQLSQSDIERIYKVYGNE